MKDIDSIVKYDIKMTSEMFNKPYVYRPKKFVNYDKVYFETNELCDKIISRNIFLNKRILTVSASGDQAFQFYKYGAEKVDLFDINKLAYYYYFLRIWNMKICGTMYPEWKIDISYIKKLLNHIEPKTLDEAIAYKYWLLFVNVFNSDALLNFFYGPTGFRNIYDVNDRDLILDRINNDNTSFYNVDISDNIDFPCKYDYIYTSNLSEYLSDEQFKSYIRNLYNLLYSNGVVLSSNLCSNYLSFNQRRIINKYFKTSKILFVDDFQDVDVIGFNFKKRKIKRLI